MRIKTTAIAKSVIFSIMISGMIWAVIAIFAFSDMMEKCEKYMKLEAKEPEALAGDVVFAQSDDGIVAYDTLHYYGLVEFHSYTIIAELIQDGISIAVSEPQEFWTGQNSSGETELSFSFPGENTNIENCTIKESIDYFTRDEIESSDFYKMRPSAWTTEPFFIEGWGIVMLLISPGIIYSSLKNDA